MLFNYAVARQAPKKTLTFPYAKAPALTHAIRTGAPLGMPRTEADFLAFLVDVSLVCGSWFRAAVSACPTWQWTVHRPRLTDTPPLPPPPRSGS